jgi:hypothetical protein
MLLFTAEENEGVSQSHPRHSEQKVYGSADVSKEQPAAYLRECMRAEGWPLRDACLDKRHMWGVFPMLSQVKKMSYVEWLGANRWCLDLLCDESPKNVPGETLSGLARRGLRRQARWENASKSLCPPN